MSLSDHPDPRDVEGDVEVPTTHEQRLAELDAELDHLMARYERISGSVHDSLRLARIGRQELKKIDQQVEQVAARRTAVAKRFWERELR